MSWLNGNQKPRASEVGHSKAGGARLRKVIGAAALFAAMTCLFGAVVLVADDPPTPQSAKERADRIAADTRRHEASLAQRPPMLPTLGGLA